MLTSSANQYLRPEYLTPLPTTLDAKKSPLALLAQTCSQIGADTPSNKSLLGSLDKPSSNKSSKSSDQSREKSSPAVAPTSTESSRTNFKPYESCLGREKASSPDEQRSASSHSTSGRSRTPGSGNKRCPSNQSASSVRAVTPQGRKTATPNGDVARESPASRTSGANLSSSQLESSTSQPTVVSSPSLQSKPSYSPAGVLAMTDPSIKDLPLGTFKPGVSLASSTSSYLGYSPQLPVDVMASSLVSQHHAALKNGLVAGNPYLSYARLKGTSGPDALMPVCRDPYCTGCQLNSHLLANSASAVANGKLASNAAGATGTCPAGCAQCDHKPGTTPYGALGVAAYAHAQLAALAAASQLPYVCNWIAGDTAYCGKRFSTSEELLQHLRSHTSMSSSGAAATDPSAAALSLLSPSVGLPPTHPLFSRTYPTPPLSPLATARYHPYGKPSPLLPPSLSSLGLPLPPPHPHTAAGLPPYFSPYSLYGAPRLGAASGMPQ
ncbi:zinc finger protein Elbow [Nomia melanderi]|uniref:zinc finger protein Elbow n=1 Tax=Nomia melanderi TaxID=2448451 RepID=UPI0013041A51|nr:zinc finger protein Elbow [Nomia melanderi]